MLNTLHLTQSSGVKLCGANMWLSELIHISYVTVGHTEKSTFFGEKRLKFCSGPAPSPVTVLFTFENIENVGHSQM